MNGTEVVTTTADPAFAVDRSGKIVAWNQAAERILGYRRSEAVGRNCWELLRGRDAWYNRYCGESCPVRAMALRGEPIHRTESFFRNASGETTRVSKSTFVVHAGGKKEIVHLLRRLSPAMQPNGALGNGITANANARLSPRQLEVLRLLGEGRETGEIAETLCISPATVRHHIQNIFRRLKVHNRLGAVTLARRIGLL